MASVKIENMEIKVEEHEIESEPPQYEHFIMTETYTFNNSNKSMLPYENSTVRQKIDSVTTLQSIHTKQGISLE